MRSSNEYGAQGISKLALLASAAVTAAFVISQTRALKRLGTPAHPERPPSPTVVDSETESSDPDESSTVRDSARLPVEAPERAASRNDDHNPPQPKSSGGRLRFRTRQSARERLHYGLPVGRHRSSSSTVAKSPVAAPLLVATPDEERSSDSADFDDEYLAILEAITNDHGSDIEDAEYLSIVEAIVNDGRPATVPLPDSAKEVVPALESETVDEEMWWQPAPRLRYIFIALIYVAMSAAVGSDPVTLAGEGLRALTTVNSTADLIVVGWVLCGMIVLIPLGAIAARLRPLMRRDWLYLPSIISPDKIESAGWGVRVVALSAFVAGAVLFTPQALGWALNTDYPVAAVSSSSMSPGLEEGELVFIDGVGSLEDLRVGDIVAFTHEQGVAVRRISGFSGGSVIARADASPDAELVIPFENITGRVLTLAGSQVKLPLLGSISLLGERTVEPNLSSISQP